MDNSTNFRIAEGSFLESSFPGENGIGDAMSSFYRWYGDCLSAGVFKVDIVKLSHLDQWRFTQDRSELVHDSGRFFRIEGLRVKTNFGEVPEWDQPIINQPEIGILGILTKIIKGTRYCLMQVKMEPGNVNILQLSPTLQATKSNFSKVHKGKPPQYLEYFINPSKARVLFDQLQTEQGGRFLAKRNRNMVVEISDEIELHDEFRWLTLAQIKELLTHDNMVNMDARSVISIIPLLDEEIQIKLQESALAQVDSLTINGHLISGFGLDLLKSACERKQPYRSEAGVISWLTSQKVKYELTTEKIPLSRLKNWTVSDEKVFGADQFFHVMGVKVFTGSREVSSWSQPLIRDERHGMLGFVVKKIAGILHFLIQAKVEPGNMDIIELSPTVTCANVEHITNSGKTIPFLDLFLSPKGGQIRFNTLQSEEGGRFFHVQNRNMIVEIDEHELSDVPDNYMWLTLHQIMTFMKYGLFNVEARSLISSLRFSLK